MIELMSAGLYYFRALSLIFLSFLSDGKIPMFVSGDANCLFNLLSMVLVGHEKLVTEIRVRTCLEMVLNRHANYDGLNAKKNERLLEDIVCFSHMASSCENHHVMRLMKESK